MVVVGVVVGWRVVADAGHAACVMVWAGDLTHCHEGWAQEGDMHTSGYDLACVLFISPPRAAVVV